MLLDIPGPDLGKIRTAVGKLNEPVPDIHIFHRVVHLFGKNRQHLALDILCCVFGGVDAIVGGSDRTYNDYREDFDLLSSLGSKLSIALTPVLKPDTVSYWKRKGAPIDQTVKMMIADGLVTALHIRKRNLAKAMAVKVAGLDSDDERLRQGVATEVIEWETGKAKQTVAADVTSGGKPVKTYMIVSPDDWDDGS